MAIDRRILLKPGPLTAQEYELIKLQTVRGEELLNSMKELKEIADIIGQHHERIDGTGYPRGLKGKDIKKTAKIISIAEAYDSMVSDHFYKKPVSRDVAISEIMEEKGMQFDPEEAWDARRQAFRISGKIVKTFHVAQSARGSTKGHWTTAIAVAVFLFPQHFNRLLV